MGIGPNGTSLLTKLGIKALSEMSESELRELVSNDRTRRSSERALGRAKRIMTSKPPVVHRVVTLESTGLDPGLIAKLRSSGKSDPELIAMLKEKGVI